MRLFHKLCNNNPCTCWFSGWFGKYWGDCCKEHDLDYVYKRVTRYEADKKQLMCMKNKGHYIMGYTMYFALRLVGGLFYGKGA